MVLPVVSDRLGLVSSGPGYPGVTESVFDSSESSQAVVAVTFRLSTTKEAPTVQ